jgi:hypothetical protein
MELMIVERDIADEDLALIAQAHVTIGGCFITLMPPCR